jgi:hypothetical protein
VDKSATSFFEFRLSFQFDRPSDYPLRAYGAWQAASPTFYTWHTWPTGFEVLRAFPLVLNRFDRKWFI